MLTISRLTDLETFGIFSLTGEADNLGYRMLCDVSASGRNLLHDVYGMSADSPPANSETNGHKHVASVMLSYRAWQDIAPIALLSKCHTVFAVKDGTVFGMEGNSAIQVCDTKSADSDDAWQYEYCPLGDGPYYRWPNSYGTIVKFYRHSDNPHVGSRNVHAMTGRTFA